MSTIQSWYDLKRQQLAEAYFKGCTSYLTELVRPQLILYVVILLFPLRAIGQNYSDVDSLMHAISANKLERAEQLLQQGASWNVRGSRNETVWCHVLAMGRVQAVELLLKYGADKNQKFQPPCRIATSERPLHIATIFLQPEVVKILINHGAEPNSLDEAGLTALHYAAINGSREIAELLLKGGADPNAKGLDGSTPTSIASAMVKQRIRDSAVLDLLTQAAGSRP